MNNIIYVDEVGYGSIAGPVLSCAVAIDNEEKIPGVNDSKKLSKKKREALYPQLQKIPHAFGTASPRKIEKLNIHWARYESMRFAVEKLLNNGIKADKVIVDGKFIIPNLSMSQEAVIKGDEKYWQIGAASILAKVKRDNVMAKLATIPKYSYYDWENNASYYTPKHREGIILHGPTTLHRKNFGYFQYCLFCHQKYQEFLEKGLTYEDYLEYEQTEAQKNGSSYYKLWKTGVYNTWKEIKPGKSWEESLC